ncbi:mechanosensitive ion channel domain-containing protein [Martelella sp. HB161492]|uniref:mechanosensitive ion channel domain-containing protein n=1 Tax=Martelella sp. HB161492 TaxID=2720726 RepID=UPI0015925985|nr:mechanosensitive ion channel domain-containing protein [Martelella sp. HB161492]
MKLDAAFMPLRLNSRHFGAFLLLVLALTLGAGQPVLAQTPDTQSNVDRANATVASDPFIDEKAQQLDTFAATYATLDKKMQESGLSDDELASLQTTADQLDSDLNQLSLDIEAKLNTVRDQIAELGKAPGSNDPPEPAVTTDQRNQLIAERSELSALSDKATKLAASAVEASKKIATMRRDLFTDALFAHTSLQDLFAADFISYVQQEYRNFQASYGAWFRYIWKERRVQLVLALGLSALAAFLFRSATIALMRRRLAQMVSEDDKPDFFIKLVTAAYSTGLPSLVIAAFLAVSYLLFYGLDVLVPDVQQFVFTTYKAIAVIFFVFLLTRNVLSPGDPAWRLIPMRTSAARKLHWAITAMAAINWGDQIIDVLNETLAADLALEAVRSFVAAILIGLILVAVSFIKPFHGDAMRQRTRAVKLLWPSLMASLIRLAGFFLLACAITGYIALARFIAMQVVLTGAILSTAYVSILLGNAVSQPGTMLRTDQGRRIAERFKLSPVRIDQISLLAGLAIYALTVLIGIPCLLVAWGMRLAEIRLWAAKHLTSVTLGSITISLGGILLAIILFVAGYLLTRWFQKWFDDNVLLRSRADPGVRNSVKTGINYLGILLAVLVAISAAGVNLSSLALVASALSIGIGFGLQTIVQNFVSGLILLIERPFKVGDWIVSGTTEGFVKRISVRATEIETFQRQSIIVPNSELINASVGNWTHHNHMGRSEIAVGVSYSSDPRKVMDILLELAKAHPLVLANPEPMVIFNGFGDSSLDFELRVYLADVFNGIPVRNDLRVAIFERFRKENIEIPFPQRDLHIITDRDGEEAAALAAEIRRRSQPIDENPNPAFDHPDAGNDDSGGR